MTLFISVSRASSLSVLLWCLGVIFQILIGAAALRLRFRLWISASDLDGSTIQAFHSKNFGEGFAF